MKGKVLVAGIGNIFLGDDAFGIEVVRQLCKHSLPNEVCVRDFGIRSYDLAYALMEEWDLVILVDALPQGGKPGTVYVLEPELGEPMTTGTTVDAHTMNPVSVLNLVRSLGGELGHILLIGCEPETVEPDEKGNIGLSAPVRGAVAVAIQAIDEWVKRSQIVANAA
jgi:hydrogenase maturation protease